MFGTKNTEKNNQIWIFPVNFRHFEKFFPSVMKIRTFQKLKPVKTFISKEQLWLILPHEDRNMDTLKLLRAQNIKYFCRFHNL